MYVQKTLSGEVFAVLSGEEAAINGILSYSWRIPEVPARSRLRSGIIARTSDPGGGSAEFG